MCILMNCLCFVRELIDMKRRLGAYMLGIEKLEDFETNFTCQLAITQLITNIQELTKKIDADIYVTVI